MIKYLIVMLLCGVLPHRVAAEAGGLVWQPYQEGVFEQARAENKIVRLNL